MLEPLCPPKCTFCSRTLRHGDREICSACRDQLPWIHGQQAEQQLEGISLCVSPLWFQGNVRDSVHRYNFSKCSVYAKAYGQLVAKCVKEHLAGRYDVITWVPLSAGSLEKRGYDQAMLLAMSTALELGDVAVETLQKQKNTSTQFSLQDVPSRKANVEGAFTVPDPALIQDKRVLLVDDVVITGSTLSECAKTLRRFGAADVVCATLARVEEQNIPDLSR